MKRVLSIDGGGIRGIIPALGMFILSGCSSGGVKDIDLFAPVPEASRRLVYEVEPASLQGAAFGEIVEKATMETVCLLRTARADECQDPGAAPAACNLRTEEELTTAIRPIFEAVLKLKLRSPSIINNQIRTAVPNAISTTEVLDARREFLCREWKSDDGACVAVRADKAWVLLHAPSQDDGTIDRFEVFLAEPVCGDDLP